MINRNLDLCHMVMSTMQPVQNGLKMNTYTSLDDSELDFDQLREDSVIFLPQTEFRRVFTRDKLAPFVVWQFLRPW